MSMERRLHTRHRARTAVYVSVPGRPGKLCRARNLSANGVFIGRAYTYGLGAMGQKGVETTLAILCREMDITMALCGVNDIKDFGPSCWWSDDCENTA